MSLHDKKSEGKKNRKYTPQHDKGYTQQTIANITLNQGKLKEFPLNLE